MLTMKHKSVLKAAAILGSQAKLAALFNRKQQTVTYWIKKGIPAEYVLTVERATDNQVTRYDLRPDLYPKPIKKKR